MAEGSRTRALQIGLALLIAAVGAGAVWLALSTPPEGSAAPTGPLAALNPQLVVRTPAPDFQLPDREGRLHRLTEHRGRPVVLNFWSSTCPPCVQELPSLIRLASLARERGDFAVIAVSVDGSWEDVSRLIPQDSQLLVLFDPQRNVVTRSYGTEAFPETFFIDPTGQVRARFDGARDWTDPAVLEALSSL